MTAVLIIAGITIKTDEEGRYCLNDLHKAAGGEKRHNPNYWFSRDETFQLIDELERENTGIPAISSKRGRNGGTYAVRELVYAYAMWISPKFHLEVIRAYDTLATQGVAVHKNAAEDLLANPMKYIEALFDQAKQIEAERKRLEQMTEAQAQQIEHLSILMTVNNFLTKHGLPVNQGNKNRLSAKALNSSWRSP